MRRILSSVRPGAVARQDVHVVPSLALGPVQMQCRYRSSSQKYTTRYGPKKEQPPKVTVEDNRPIEEIIRGIDTTLNPRQRLHVEALKRSYKGGANSPRSIYRDVPTREEIKENNLDLNYSPKMAENAEELIDWALSHIPERGGKRRSRAKRRAARRQEAQRLEHATRKNQVYLAKKRQAKKMEKHRALEMKYRAEAIRLYGDKSNSSVQEQQASS